MIHVLITSLVLAQPAGQASATDAIKKFVQRCEEAKAAAIKEREAALKSLTGQQLAAAQAALKRFQDAPGSLLPLPIPPAKDDVGIFTPPRPTDARHGRGVDVLEVVGPEDAILRVWYAPSGAAPSDEAT